MRKEIFLKIFIVSLISILILAIASVSVMYYVGEKDIKDSLVVNTQIVSRLISNNNYEDLSSIEDFGNARITIINDSGEVVYDTDSNSIRDNHLTREEVVAAKEGTPKVVRRYSTTLRHNMYYYAVYNESQGCYVRLAIWSNQLGQYILNALPFIGMAIVVSMIIAYILSRFFSEKITAQFAMINTSLRSLNYGMYVPIKANMQQEELYSTLTEMNTLFSNTNNAMTKLSEETNKLSFVLNNVSQGIIAVNDQGQIKLINNKARELFNKDGEYLNKNIEYLVDNSVVEEFNKITGNGYYSFNTVSSGRALKFTVASFENGAISHDIARIIIITDRTKEEQLINEKSDFFANASHELKTPLTTIQGMSELLTQDGNLNAKEQGYIERMLKETTRLNNIVQDMLKLSDIERSQSVKNIVPISLNKLCQEIVEEQSSNAAKKEIKTTISGEATIQADMSDITSVINNLYSNAINYNKEKGTIELLIEEKDSEVLFTVKDSGIGIASQDLPRLCERFFRVDKSRSKKTGGTGLGLSIVKHICMSMGAQLNIKSELGVGTEFQIKFIK